MNFTKAHVELLLGKKIRRKEWEPLLHLKIVNEEVKAFRGEFSNFYEDSTILISDGWLIVEGDGKTMSFIEALEEMKIKKCLRKADWPEDMFVFVDKDNLAICKPVEYDFMPTYKCLCANDWEIIK